MNLLGLAKRVTGFGKRPYVPLNSVVIFQNALKHNHFELQKRHPHAAICPVLKSNAYGHGLLPTARIFDRMKLPFLVVDSLYEAYELYKIGVKTPILITGYTAPQNFILKPVPFHVAVFDIDLARTLNEYQPGCNVHIFIDSGMSREGITVSDLPAFLEELKILKNLKVVGLCSHLADADNPQSTAHMNSQIDTFKQAYAIVKEYGFDPKWRHISASGGAFKIMDETFTMLRVGLAHYGISPLEETDPHKNAVSLMPALEFHSTLAQIKKIPKGAVVGYGCTYTASSDMTVGLLPAGYYEGVDRRLSSKGFVKIREHMCPIIGRVSMNMTTIDITGLKNPTVGEKVVVYSSYPKDRNSLVNTAKIAETIPYDLLVHLAESVKRVVI
ncbi:MAG: alanine racemase [Microgenomates group bacterium]